MKRRLLKQLSVKSAAVLIGLVTLCFIASCSKDKTVTPATPKGKNAKFTISVNGAAAASYISFVFSGGTGDASGNSTIWKVNGVAQNNETAISLGKNDFTGGTTTYVIESTTPLGAIAVGVQCLGYDPDTYTISYKAEIDGVVQRDDANVTVSQSQDYTHQFSY